MQSILFQNIHIFLCRSLFVLLFLFSYGQSIVCPSSKFSRSGSHFHVLLVGVGTCDLTPSQISEIYTPHIPIFSTIIKRKLAFGISSTFFATSPGQIRLLCQNKNVSNCYYGNKNGEKVAYSNLLRHEII